jgi:RNA polymerase sigma-70 factor, ECF subfamily
VRGSTLQNGWRDPAEAPAVGIGPVSWRGQLGAPLSTGGYGGPPESLGSAGTVADDASLAERSRVDADAFGALYDRYCDRIYRYVFRRLRNHEAAEDVTADIFLKVLRAIDTYRRTTAPFSTWLYRIAANAVVDYARGRRITTSLDATTDAADVGVSVEELAITRVEAARVWQAVDNLTEAQRTAVTLRFGSDLPIADIAEQMGRTEGAVKLLLNRGLAAVRAQLRGLHVAEDRL